GIHCHLRRQCHQRHQRRRGHAELTQGETMPGAVTASKGHVQIVPGRNDRDEHVFSVLVKRTYRIYADRPATRHDEDRPIRLIDEYYDGGDPEWSTVQHESEVAPFKAQTAVASFARPARRQGFPRDGPRVGGRSGDGEKYWSAMATRICLFDKNKPPFSSDPEPFTDMELRYDRAYGGRDEKSVPTIP